MIVTVDEKQICWKAGEKRLLVLHGVFDILTNARTDKRYLIEPRRFAEKIKNTLDLSESGVFFITLSP